MAGRHRTSLRRQAPVPEPPDSPPRNRRASAPHPPGSGRDGSARRWGGSGCPPRSSRSGCSAYILCAYCFWLFISRRLRFYCYAAALVVIGCPRHLPFFFFSSSESPDMSFICSRHRLNPVHSLFSCNYPKEHLQRQRQGISCLFQGNTQIGTICGRLPLKKSRYSFGPCRRSMVPYLCKEKRRTWIGLTHAVQMTYQAGRRMKYIYKVNSMFLLNIIFYCIIVVLSFSAGMMSAA